MRVLDTKHNLVTFYQIVYLRSVPKSPHLCQGLYQWQLPAFMLMVGNGVLLYCSSNWRCVTIHGTNGVTLQGNVGFNVHGHCFYLEDGVEERNVLDTNLAVFVHPIFTAGSGGGQGVRRFCAAAACILRKRKGL